MKNGRITKEEIEKANKGKSETTIDRTSPEYFTTIENIVTYLKKGWKNYNIRKELDINTFDFKTYMLDIKRKKIITSEEIKVAREKKRQDDLQFVADSVNNGLTMEQIRELRPEFSYNEVTPMIKELIDKGVITQEQVDKNRKNGIRETMNKGVELSPDEQVEFILDKVKKGYTPAEIIECDKTKSLTMHKVLYQKKRLIAEGIITEEEANNAMQKRQASELEKKHNKVIQKVKEYTELGYTLLEISGFITEYNYNYIVIIKNEYAKENGWYTKEELKNFAVLREIREEEEEQARLTRERKEAEKAIREQKEIAKALNKERKQKIKGYAETYKRYKKIAKKEDDLELDGEEKVPTEGRRKFIETLIALHNLDADLPDEDIEVVINAFDMHPEFVNKDSIKFVISDANKKGGLRSVEKRINELSDILRYTKFYKPLVEYGRWLRKIAMRPKIKEMKKQGMNNTQIGEKLGITSAEVSVIFNNNKELDFSDFGSR